LPRKALYAIYSLLSVPHRERFHSEFAKLFRNGITRSRPGTWSVKFAGKDILIPLSPDTLWLDWDLAVSIPGHDTEVKETHAALIGHRSNRPQVFVDIGANCGTHSLLFLVHGIPSLSSEPIEE
jgi:hypothetical protein